ncbi:MAG: DUF5777 family beta-barrel protein [Longimicrobiales bacterium]
MSRHRFVRRTLPALVGLGLVPALAQGQAAPQPPVTIFLSDHAANLPTAATLRDGTFQFEISHRFGPPVSEGADALFGFDGPVINRIGLSMGVSDEVTVGVLRSNLSDNLEFNAKARVGQGGGGSMPFMVALKGGLAFNTQLPDAPGIDGSEPQWYGQVILNGKVGSDLAIGVVPTVLGNPDIDAEEKGTTVSVGVNGQLYLTRRTSLLAEWIFSEEQTNRPYDSGTFGVEMRVGGHFFKLVLTNQQFMNPTQHLTGASRKFEPDEWRVGFNITRRF